MILSDYDRGLLASKIETANPLRPVHCAGRMNSLTSTCCTNDMALCLAWEGYHQDPPKMNQKTRHTLSFSSSPYLPLPYGPASLYASVRIPHLLRYICGEMVQVSVIPCISDKQTDADAFIRQRYATTLAVDHWSKYQVGLAVGSEDTAVNELTGDSLVSTCRQL